MQMRSSLLVPYALLGVFLTSALPTWAGAAKNLMPEGSFELLERGLPEGWKMPDPNWYKNFRGEATVKTEKGNRYLHLVCPVLNQLLGANYTFPITEDMQRLRLSYRVRAEIKELATNDGTGVGVALLPWWGNVETTQAQFGGAEWITESTKDWVSKKVELDVPKGATVLTLTVGIKAADAIADFDDVSVEVLR